MGFNSYSKSIFINLLAGYNGLVEAYNPIIFRDFMHILTLIYFHIETHVNLQKETQTIYDTFEILSYSFNTFNAFDTFNPLKKTIIGPY